MGQHSLPSGSELRNIVFRDQILFVELDHGFQLTVADSRLFILPDILTVFTLTGQIRLGEGCVTVGRNLCPETFPILVLMDSLLLGIFRSVEIVKLHLLSSFPHFSATKKDAYLLRNAENKRP